MTTGSTIDNFWFPTNNDFEFSHEIIETMVYDSMLMVNDRKSKEKRVFKIEVGTIPDNDVEEYVKKISEGFKIKPNEYRR